MNRYLHLVSIGSNLRQKQKDFKRVAAALKSQENYMKNLKDKLLKDNQMVQMALKEFIGNIQ